MGSAVGQGTGTYQPPELASDPRPAEGGGQPAPAPPASPANRRLSPPSNEGEAVTSAARAGGAEGAAAAASLSFDGLNHRDQRTANEGNQWSLEPPDQGLCTGNGFVMETVNDVLRVFDSTGNPVSGVVDLNSFYGYAAAIDRTTGKQGPSITDPSCLYDADVDRWFHVVLTLEVKPKTGAFTGKNHLDLAVSNTGDPTGTWTIYKIPVQDDGTEGTPDHHCPLNNDGSGHGPCLGDYPHIGADATGLYITTNEYAFFPDNIFHAAQVYAFSKRALAAAPKKVSMQQFDTKSEGFGGQPGFTVWPAISPQGSASQDNGGTEYFMSSDAAEEASGVPGTRSNRLLVWKLTNTSSLDAAKPDLDLENQIFKVGRYSPPPPSEQKRGDTPLRQCINDTKIKTPFGRGCWQYLFTVEPAHDEVIAALDSLDSRMQQVWYADGKLFGALGTGVKINGDSQAGIQWFVVDPSAGALVNIGFLAVANTNLIMPAIATDAAGAGVMAFTLVGENDFPSAAYATINSTGVGPVQVVAPGAGPQDGFTGYKALVGDPPRPRWGDYGAAAFDGANLWIASEYIGQTCSLNQYLADPLGSCGATRTALANWGTRISQVTP